MTRARPRTGLALIVVLMTALALASCGRKGDPTLPRGVSDSYPAGYPAGAPSTRENIYRDIEPE